MTFEYLAGIIDGEGHLRMETSNYKYRCLRIAVVNTHRPLLDAIQRTFGGKIRDHSGPNRPERWSQSWTWDIGGQNALPILRSVLPFLIVKRAKAIELLAEVDGNFKALKHDCVYWCGEEIA